MIHIHDHLQLHASQYKHKTQHLSYIPLTQKYNILQHSNVKNTIFNNGATQQTFPHTSTQSLQQTKTNMRHIHTSIVSGHLATRGNYKILRTQ